MKLQLKGKYTSGQRAILQALKSNKVATTDDIVEVYKIVTGKEISRTSVIVKLRGMSSKLIDDGYVIKRLSTVGRGVIGSWELRDIKEI